MLQNNQDGKGGIIAHYCNIIVQYPIPPSQPPFTFIAYNIAQYIFTTTPLLQ